MCIMLNFVPYHPRLFFLYNCRWLYSEFNLFWIYFRRPSGNVWKLYIILDLALFRNEFLIKMYQKFLIYLVKYIKVYLRFDCCLISISYTSFTERTEIQNYTKMLCTILMLIDQYLLHERVFSLTKRKTLN